MEENPSRGAHALGNCSHKNVDFTIQISVQQNQFLYIIKDIAVTRKRTDNME